MKIFISMRPVVALCLCLTLQWSKAVQIHHGLLVGSEKRSFSQKECFKVVSKVQGTGKYTEESIVPVCKEEMKSGDCDFFAEALSLATSHGDFKSATFCRNMGRAQFCSALMDKLLESRAMSDLAFGECERAKPHKGIKYCRKIQQMLSMSVKQEDLDTLRACYMMEAFTAPASQAAPKKRIITGNNKELSSAGGETPGQPRQTIAVQASPMNTFGKGRGNLTSPKSEKIVAQPIPVQTMPLESFGKGNASITEPTAIITEPIAADEPTTTPQPKQPNTIVVEPIPADNNTTAHKPTNQTTKIIVEPIPANSSSTESQPQQPEGIVAVPVPMPPVPVFVVPATPQVLAPLAPLAPLRAIDASVAVPIPESLPLPLTQDLLVPPPPFQVATILPKPTPPRASGAQPATKAAVASSILHSEPPPPAILAAAKPVVQTSPRVKEALEKPARVAVAQHKAGLVQGHLGSGKVALQDKAENIRKDEYSGFLSKFIA